jgi:hypothetical protein
MVCVTIVAVVGGHVQKGVGSSLDRRESLDVDSFSTDSEVMKKMEMIDTHLLTLLKELERIQILMKANVTCLESEQPDSQKEEMSTENSELCMSLEA